MNLRLRLIVAFFLLSVVPLGAVTFYTYTSNATSMREAAGREANLLAGELTDRMTLVTSQLSQRFVQLMDIPAPAELKTTALSAVPAPAKARTVATTRKPTQTKVTVDAAAAATAEADSTAAAAVAAAKTEEATRVAQQLGEVAILLNNIDIRG